MAGLLDAFKQYISDVMPGGVLNPEGAQVSHAFKRGAEELRQGLLAYGAANKAAIENPTWGNVKAAVDNNMTAAGVAPLGILRNPHMQSAAISHFGETAIPSETGFILDNGKRLDLSGRHYASGYQRVGDAYKPISGQPDYLRGGRNVDHRELDDLVSGQGWDGLADFLNQTGAVRYMPDVGISVVDTNLPSIRQIEKAVVDFRKSKTPMNVDVDTLSGNGRASMEFERPTVDAVMEFVQRHMRPDAGLLGVVK